MNKAMSSTLAANLPDEAAPVQNAAATSAQALPKARPAADEIGVASTLLDGSTQQAGTQTLLRGLAILEAAAAGVRDLRSFGAVLGTTRSTTHRLVSSLVQARYLRQVQGGYLLGPKLIELGTIALEQMPLTAVARAHLQALADETLDTIHLGVRDGDDVLYIDKIPGQRGLEMRSRVGHRMPLASTGIGKAMMLDLAPQSWRDLFDASRRTLAGVSFRPDHSLEPDTFLKRMATYSAGGYTFDLEENEISIRCVAAPVRDASGAIVAALSVASTIPYMPLERMDELIPVVQREARAISQELGWRAPQPATRRIRR
ncbi:IclR family transcriptional regulator [Paraburkholderia silvatlantica]|uniref:DNA-binding IclR family transcriptional regulator n=1 Tax=Paraburkholderia silvatlantica TaxID=321895 RepID=A0ABR6FTT2_9BURK|nr:IclR family transcriptional regulator [Paraburkholderia silvatlantica]MBB2930829.1 DNA-binding IclR family transcriptional regulator [Paraburkholderia silvatlantica]PVY31982.1 IclR family transcriptional regulator [Paraburkholderia silvatlantica]PXW37553.1 IclR family transcriptional regulator [Paraburkholderia silvatlantica]